MDYYGTPAIIRINFPIMPTWNSVFKVYTENQQNSVFCYFLLMNCCLLNAMWEMFHVNSRRETISQQIYHIEWSEAWPWLEIGLSLEKGTDNPSLAIDCHFGFSTLVKSVLSIFLFITKGITCIYAKYNYDFRVLKSVILFKNLHCDYLRRIKFSRSDTPFFMIVFINALCWTFSSDCLLVRVMNFDDWPGRWLI